MNAPGNNTACPGERCLKPDAAGFIWSMAIGFSYRGFSFMVLQGSRRRSCWTGQSQRSSS